MSPIEARERVSATLTQQQIESYKEQGVELEFFGSMGTPPSGEELFLVTLPRDALPQHRNGLSQNGDEREEKRWNIF